MAPCTPPSDASMPGSIGRSGGTPSALVRLICWPHRGWLLRVASSPLAPPGLAVSVAAYHYTARPEERNLGLSGTRAYSKLSASNQRVPIGSMITFPYDCCSQAKEGMMAQRVEVILEDDIDGSPADETVRFALNGTSIRDRSLERECASSTKRAGRIHRARPQSVSCISSGTWPAEAHRQLRGARMGEGAGQRDQRAWTDSGLGDEGIRGRAGVVTASRARPSAPIAQPSRPDERRPVLQRVMAVGCLGHHGDPGSAI